MNLAEKWLCRIFASRFCKCQSWNVDFFNEFSGKIALQNFYIQILQLSKLKCRISPYLFLVDFLMNLAEMWLCKIFASSRFLSWNVEFLHDPFVVIDFVMNLAGKLLCRIFASSLQVKMQNFCIIRICYNYFLWFFLQLLVLKKTTLFSQCNILGLFFDFVHYRHFLL